MIALFVLLALGVDGLHLFEPRSSAPNYATRGKTLFDILGVEDDRASSSFYGEPKHETEYSGDEKDSDDEKSNHYLIKYHPNVAFNKASSSEANKIPKLIIQQGSARTATTLQFQSLCAAMFLLHPDEVDCKYVRFEKPGDSSLDFSEDARYRVFKAHQNPFKNKTKAKILMAKPFWLFLTSKTTNLPDSNTLGEAFGVHPQYIQALDVVKKTGWEVVADYAPIFKLSPTQKTQFLDYMKPWSLLRQCCGPQQSKKHRAVLRNKIPSSQCPACDGQDLDAVEAELIKTPVWISMSKSGRDAQFNGHHCTWFNRQVACKHLGFNEEPKKPYC